jgi:hypothetical protein
MNRAPVACGRNFDVFGLVDDLISWALAMLGDDGIGRCGPVPQHVGRSVPHLCLCFVGQSSSGFDKRERRFRGGAIWWLFMKRRFDRSSESRGSFILLLASFANSGHPL